MLEQICVQQLKNKALMIPETYVLLHPNNIMLVIWVFSHQEFQKLGLLLSKFMVNLCVPVDLYRNFFPRFMIHTWYDLSEWAFAKNF